MNNEIKNENANIKAKKKYTGWIVAGVILLVVILGIIIIPKLLFSDYEGLPTTGEYEVKMTSAILTDESRTEEFETDGSKREVPIYFFYPDAEGKADEFPLVIFSHGAFGYYQSNTSTYMELASHGYVVASLDHPYHSFFTADTDGKTVIVNPEFMQQVMSINGSDMPEDEIIRLSHTWLKLRIDDIGFVLDTVKAAKGADALGGAWFTADDGTEEEINSIIKMTDTEKIGLMGHSLGGAASTTLGRTRDDIDAVINLDGTMLGEELGYKDGVYDFYDGEYPIPLLFISNEEHHFDSQEVSSLYVNNVVLENALDGSYTYFEGSGHMNFTDLPLFSPALASMLGIGDVDAQECIVAMNEIILDYYDDNLKGEGEAVINEKY